MSETHTTLNWTSFSTHNTYGAFFQPQGVYSHTDDDCDWLLDHKPRLFHEVAAEQVYTINRMKHGP